MVVTAHNVRSDKYILLEELHLTGVLALPKNGGPAIFGPLGTYVHTDIRHKLIVKDARSQLRKKLPLNSCELISATTLPRPRFFTIPLAL